MSMLVVDQLKNNSNVDINIRTQYSKSIHAVRLKMIKHGVISDGEFKLQLVEGGEVLAESVLDLDELSNLATYAHGYFKFELPYTVRVNSSNNVETTDVTFRVTVSNHTDSDDNYLALVKQHEYKYISEFGSYPAPANTEAEKAWYSPYGIQLYTYSNN